MLWNLAKPLLFCLSPETAHETIKCLARGWALTPLQKHTTIKSTLLKAKIGPSPLPNPIGLAAGFDKNGEMLPLIQALGFGFVELGSVSFKACHGRPKPRIFRLPHDHSLINRMGLPNHGAQAFAKTMTHNSTKLKYGVSLVKTPDFAFNDDETPLEGIDDFLKSFEKMYFLGAYTVLNLSCPNSGDGKTFEDPVLFEELIATVQKSKKQKGSQKPLLIKLSPDLPTKQVKKLVNLALKNNIDGFVLSNTSTSRASLKSSQSLIQNIGMGGLSGEALKAKSNKLIKTVYDITQGRSTIIGCGGIMDANDVAEKIALGADLVQAYTGLIYKGPLFVRDLNQGLIQICKDYGAKHYLDLRKDPKILKFISS